jgi:A/G-specific adenine glycosylase
MEKEQFQDIIWPYYGENGRSFPWRDTDNPYCITVSEFMLQQTQTSRVVGKYQQFIQEVPDWEALAGLPLPQLLGLWQGLGYNRRALYLQNTARHIVEKLNGILPDAPEILETLPGIGYSTAGAIVAFAYDKPTVFIETNIRRVFLHFFFPEQESVHDRDLMPLIATMLDHSRPRHWYYALMDYGAMLKTKEGNPNTRSAHYTRQSKFDGSDRQIRGAVVRYLLNQPQGTVSEFARSIQADPARVRFILLSMQKENFIVFDGDRLGLA